MDPELGAALPALHPDLPAGPQHFQPALAFLAFHHR
jgi:hypothetical protein